MPSNRRAGIQTSYLMIFITLYLLGNIFLYFQFTHTLQLFTLEQKSFTVSQTQSVHPINLIAEKFTCNGTNPTANCHSYVFIALFLFLSLEGYVVYIFTRKKKKIPKKVLIAKVLLLQLLLFIPITVLILSPAAVFNNLVKQADGEIKNGVYVLSSSEQLHKRRIENSLPLIQKKLNSESSLPTLIEESPKDQAILELLGVDVNKENSLYKVSIVPFQVHYGKEVAFEKDKINFQVLLFPNNTLIVQNSSKDVVEGIGPTLALMLTKHAFLSYLEKLEKTPIVDVPDEKTYLSIRKKEETKTIQELEDQLQVAKKSVNQLDEYIKETQLYKKDSEEQLKDYEPQTHDWFIGCVKNLGESNETCQNGKKEIDKNLGILKKNISETESKIEEAKKSRATAIYYFSLAKQYYDQFLKNPGIPENEDGIFVPPNTIHLKYQPEKKYAFSYYLSVAVHEYLHFSSYATSGESFALPSFLEEGLTDYFKLTIINDFLKRDSKYLNYPTEIDLLKEIAKSIPQESLKDIYFSKNEKELEKRIDKSFGIGKYALLKEKGKILSSATIANDASTEAKLKNEMFKLLFEKQSSPSSAPN